MNKDRLYLDSISDCLERIAEYTESGEDAFLASRLIQDGVIRNLEVIGEATKNISKALLEAVVGSVVGLIALFSSYDHINLPHRQFSLQQQWGVWLIAASLPLLFADA